MKSSLSFRGITPPSASTPGSNADARRLAEEIGSIDEGDALCLLADGYVVTRTFAIGYFTSHSNTVLIGPKTVEQIERWLLDHQM